MADGWARAVTSIWPKLASLFTTIRARGFWSQTVAEFGLALTLCGLRRIPQLHREIIQSQAPWDYEPSEGQGRPGARGHQFGDDSAFASGTLCGKRVRIVGARQYRQPLRQLRVDAGG